MEVGLRELGLLGPLLLLILVSIVGNCLVCVAIFTDRRLRKLGNAFIVSLAIADLFVSCLVMTFAACNDLMNYWIFGDWFCDVWISFDIMCCTASILNLCAISLDRFVHIKDCLLYNQWMTRRVALAAVLIIWFISALVSFVPINLGWHRPNHFGRPNNSSSVLAKLDYNWPQTLPSESGSSVGQFNQVATLRMTTLTPTPEPTASQLDELPQCALNLTPTYAVVSSAISFYIPCLIMLALYSRLFACARKHVRHIQANSKPRLPLKQPARAWLRVARAPRESPTATSEETDRQQQPDSLVQAAERDAFLESSARLQASGENCSSNTTTITFPTSGQSQLRRDLQQQQQQQQQQHSGQLATHKAAVTLGIIMGTFLFCWVPFFCLNIIKAFCADCITSSLFRAFTWLGYANSALNPIIYGIHNSEFRNAFNRIFFKHLNFKNSRYYLNRRFSYDLRHTNNHLRERATQMESAHKHFSKSDQVT